MKVQRWLEYCGKYVTVDYFGDEIISHPDFWCKSEDVAELEAKCAELEVKCAELEKQLEGYTEAFDCIRDAMSFAERAIADPDSVAVVVMPDVIEEPLNAELVAAAKDVITRWDSPLWSMEAHTADFINRLREVVAKAEGDNHDQP